jgi:GlpG protein
MTNPLKKLDYNSPVILTYAIICVVLLILNDITGGWLNYTLLVCRPHPNLLDPLTLVRSIMHIFGHSSWSHLLNNMILMMLVGPVVEEKYGSGNLIIMILSDAVVTAIINGIFFDTGILGASGVVFMLIILSAFTNMQKGRIPVTLCIVAVLYLGQELADGIANPNDGISHMGHIVGGVVGLFWGIVFYRKKFGSGNQSH